MDDNIKRQDADLLIKVCGMRHADNIKDVLRLQPNLMGFIFYDKSPRFAGERPCDGFCGIEFGNTHRVGVFVNSPLDYVLEKVTLFGLEYVQLHGAETPQLCGDLQRKGVKVIKAFSIKSEVDFARIADYENVTSLSLLDTKAPGYGGSGCKFDWNLLSLYHSRVPFLLSGGIEAGDIETLKAIELPQFAGVDLNSRFETEPAVKDAGKLRLFMAKLRETQQTQKKQQK